MRSKEQVEELLKAATEGSNGAAAANNYEVFLVSATARDLCEWILQNGDGEKRIEAVIERYRGQKRHRVN